MKANQKVSLRKNGQGYMQVVGGIVALLIALIIGVMLYFSVVDTVDEFSEVTETFTGYAWATANASAWSITLGNSPASSTVTNVTCYNGTAGTESYPTFILNHETINVAADAADVFSQVNVTYTSNIATDEGDVTDMAQNVFGIAPLIAIVVIAAIILGVVLAFGSGRKGGGL